MCATFHFSTNNQIANNNMKLENFPGFVAFSPWSRIENVVKTILNRQPTMPIYLYVTRGWVLVAW